MMSYDRNNACADKEQDSVLWQSNIRYEGTTEGCNIFSPEFDNLMDEGHAVVFIPRQKFSNDMTTIL